MVAFVGSWIFIEETRRDNERKLDWIVFATLVIVVLSIQLGLRPCTNDHLQQQLLDHRGRPPGDGPTTTAGNRAERAWLR